MGFFRETRVQRFQEVVMNFRPSQFWGSTVPSLSSVMSRGRKKSARIDSSMLLPGTGEILDPLWSSTLGRRSPST